MSSTERYGSAQPEQMCLWYQRQERDHMYVTQQASTTWSETYQVPCLHGLSPSGKVISEPCEQAPHGLQ